jgi:acetyl esterase/lipase
MRFFTENLQPNEALLSFYIHDDSQELSNAAMRPGMLVLPGGAYMHCSDREAEPVALAYMAQGCNAFVLRYTVGPEATFEQALEDAEAALGYIRDNAEKLRVDKDRIAVVGFSAGGHLAGALGTMGKVKPQAMILGYPVTQEYMGRGLKTMPGLDAKVGAATPPAFIFSTQNDTMVPIDNSLIFASALAKAGIPFELHIFLDGQHGLSLAQAATSNGNGAMVSEDVAQWFTLSVKWLKNLWGDFSYAPKPAPLPGDKPGKKRNIDMRFLDLLKDPVRIAIVKRYIPEIEDTLRQNPIVGIITPRSMAASAPDRLNAAILEKLDADLAGC